jgi:hypothetical protein
VNEYTVKPLGPGTWNAFAALAERHNGVWGGCWCTWIHTLQGEKTFSAEDNRAPNAPSRFLAREARRSKAPPPTSRQLGRWGLVPGDRAHVTVRTTLPVFWPVST